MTDKAFRPSLDAGVEDRAYRSHQWIEAVMDTLETFDSVGGIQCAAHPLDNDRLAQNLEILAHLASEAALHVQTRHQEWLDEERWWSENRNRICGGTQ